MEAEKVDEFARRIQEYLSMPPVIVLGSGASAPHGIPTMSELAEAILSDPQISSDFRCKSFRSCLESGQNLEAAINDAHLETELFEHVREIIWRCINNAELSFIEKAISKNQPLPLERVLDKILNTSSRKVSIVTTNYDRLAEIATDKVGAHCITGFYGHLIRRPDFDCVDQRAKNARRQERLVELWKVHGSLDWFINDQDHIVSLTMPNDIPKGCAPLIVPPSKEKYAESSQNPYRSVISKADEAFRQASCILCVGYGFGDQHIHPLLKQRAESGTALVVLARTLTDSCKQWLDSAQPPKYLAIERADDKHSHVKSDYGDDIVEGEYWNIEELMSIW